MARTLINATDVDPEVENLFNALAALMGTEYVATNAFGNYDGAGINLSVACSDFNTPVANRWSYSEYRAGIRVSVSPTSVALHAGGTQQFTATATNPDNTPVASPTFTWAVSGPGTVSATGLYTAPATIAAQTSAQVRCALTGGTSWATVTVVLNP